MKSLRILSIDLLRGLTVAGMILVNNPGTWSNMYWPLKHAKWDGCTPTDLVFPFFLFAVGASIPFSISNGIQEFPKILKRAFILVFLGLVLNFFGEWSFSNLRFPGVLQRIGFAYFFGAVLYGEKNLKVRIFLFLSLLVAYWYLLEFVPPPGASEPSMKEGKDWGAWIDRQLFGQAHLWKFGKVWDPEGLLTSFASIVSVFCGIFTGEFVKVSSERKESPLSVSGKIALGGFILLLVGGIWGIYYPINKSLWTGTYSLWTAGWALVVISLFTVLEKYNIFGFGSLQSFLLPFGKNALLVFFGSGIFARSLNIIMVTSPEGKKIPLKNMIYQEYYKSWIESPELSSFLYSVTVLVLWFLILFLLDKKRLYWRI
nr:heparan-alpha-glucosaminide N-acetyltransferase domain-containing protein [Leptospira sp. B5-022]